MDQRVGTEFLTQCAPVDAENTCGLTLIAVCEVEDGLEQRAFDFSDDEVVQVSRTITIERGEIVLERVFSVFAEWFLAFKGFQLFIALFRLLLGHVQ